ncbi:phosphatidate cytidylyltransferase [Piscinibacter sp.]|jgi:phosphatidate cytidylyltransferase|uniref:phosphatidate cytidylyltransferase n=1 Tax=Piscinibacter sp. TaxID=1903157 RepID=UPI00355AC1E9
MLKQRVITALVLLAILLPALFAPVVWPFAVVTLVMIGAAGWEWARLNGASFAAAVGMGALLCVACGGALWAGWVSAAPRAAWWCATLVWVLGGAWALKGGPAAWSSLSKPLRWTLGLVALWMAWLALANARAAGVNFILSVFCLVWAADIAAYFGGKAFGKRKLAPAISPGKSWEGVWSGMAGVLALAALWISLDRSLAVDSKSLYTLLRERHGTFGLVLVLVFLAAMSVVGDLMESLVKRSAGVKDSSGLLPGHGGVLDRVDALLPVFPLALAMSSM